MIINLRDFYPYYTYDALVKVSDEIGSVLGLSMNFEAVTARYVDVRLERKKEVLDAYHAAVHPQPKQARQTTPKQEKQTPKRKASEMML